MRYKPFGEVRYTWKDAALTQTTPAYALTKWTFTGQYSCADDPSTPGVKDFGLLYFSARWVDPYLNRFAQADTVIPGAGDPQAPLGEGLPTPPTKDRQVSTSLADGAPRPVRPVGLVRPSRPNSEPVSTFASC